MRWKMLLLAGLMSVWPAAAEDTALRTAFEQRYREYLRPDSQALLPFPRMEKADWKKLQEIQSLQVVFVAPDRYYNAKVYTLTLYQAGDGRYYLDARGGFWGMDALVYGPLQESDLK